VSADEASLLRRRRLVIGSLSDSDTTTNLQNGMLDDMLEEDLPVVWKRFAQEINSMSMSDIPCEAEVETFSTSILFDFEGPVGVANATNLGELEEVLKDSYNAVAGCDQPNAFITVENVTIDVDIVQSVGSNIGTGNEERVEFTWYVTFEGTCRGCSAGMSDPPLFDDSNSGTCSCEFPTVEAFTAECNDRLRSFSIGPVGTFTLRSVTPLTFGGVGGGGGGLSSFNARVLLSGQGGLFEASGLALTFSRFIMETYNSLSFLNSENCDPEQRVITSVVPEPAVAEEPDENGNPVFSIIFNIIGSCRNCGQTTVIFGAHEAAQADTSGCPADATITCPTEEEFAKGLQDLIASTNTTVLSASQPPCGGICDDDNLCTIDTCNVATDTCSFEPVSCGANEVCDALSGSCEDIQNLVPCVGVIDEWNNRNYAAEWAQFRATYPKRPFCLLVPNSFVQTL